MCVAGCRDIIAAQWRIADGHTAEFPGICMNISSPQTKRRRSYIQARPKALRDAARSLRDAYPDQPERWAPFICATTGLLTGGALHNTAFCIAGPTDFY